MYDNTTCWFGLHDYQILIYPTSTSTASVNYCNRTLLLYDLAPFWTVNNYSKESYLLSFRDPPLGVSFLSLVHTFKKIGMLRAQ